MPRVTFSSLRTLITATAVVLLAACTSSPPKPTVDFKQSYDFYNARTIAFYRNSGQVSGDNPMQLSDMERNRIDKALQQSLAIKGYEFVEDESKADLLISWHLVTQNKTDVRTYQSASYGGGYGYGGYGGYGGYNRHSMYNCWNCSPTHTEVSVKDYTQGTFIVDMIDVGLKQSVWRGETQSRLKGKAEHDQDKYNEAANAIFFSFPP